MKEFKIRASSSGKLMGKKGLGKTGLSVAENWIKSQVFNRQTEIKSKYLDKGNIMEDESLDRVAENLDMGLLVKNEKHFQDDYMTGTPDAIVGDCIIDVKNSWDWTTFPLLDKEIPNTDYYYQLQCYMALTESKSAKLIYTLLDTPIHLIEREARYYCLNNGYEEMETSIYEKFVKKMTYSDIPEKNKYKCFDVERDDSAIELIKQRVLECREHLKQFDL